MSFGCREVRLAAAVGGDVGTGVTLPAFCNTNGNANSDVAEADFIRGTVSARLSGNDPLLSRPPLASGQDMQSCSQLLQSTEMETSLSLPRNSPIAGTLPADTMPNIASPSLGFDLSRGESLAHSPNSPTAAKCPSSSSRLDTISTTVNSPTSATPSPPTSLLPQSILIDPRSPLGLPTGMLLPRGLPASVTMSLAEEEEDEEAQICLWDSCGKEFPNLQGLVNHLDREHTLSMVKYVCLWRDCVRSMKPFDARYKLVTHLRCHTGEKPYKCDVVSCSRSFSRLENLKLHIRTHTGEKPYVCHFDGCNKRFNNTSDRAKHMKTHITRKPYACRYPGCGKSYTDPSSMRKHVKFAHKMKERDSADESRTQGSVSPELLSPRKLSMGSSSSGSSPRTPHTPLTIVLQKPINAVTISPAGTVFPSTSPGLPQTVRIFSPPPSFTPSFTPSSSPSSCSSSSSSTPSSLSCPMSYSVANQTTNCSLQQTPLISMPAYFQLPGQPQLIQQGQQILMPANNSQQQFVMLLPSSAVAGNSLEMNKGQSSSQNVLQGSPLVTTTSSSDSQQKLLQLSQQQLSIHSSGITSTSLLRDQRGGGGGGGLEAAPRDCESAAIKQQLQMKIAHLQRELTQCQSPAVSLGTHHDVGGERDKLVTQAGQEGGSGANLPLLSSQSRVGTSPTKVTMATAVQAPAQPTILGVFQASNGTQLPLSQPLTITHAAPHFSVANGIIPTAQLSQPQPTSTTAHVPVTTLTASMAQDYPHPLQLGSSPFAKHFTVMPTPILNLGVAPGQSTPMVLSQFMVPGTQFVPTIVQPQMPPQILQVTTLPQCDGKT